MIKVDITDIELCEIISLIETAGKYTGKEKQFDTIAKKLRAGIGIV